MLSNTTSPRLILLSNATVARKSSCITAMITILVDNDKSQALTDDIDILE